MAQSLSKKDTSRALFIGTSGFSYDDWVGPFYPAGLKKGEWFDFYAAEFSCLEINSSYYSWLARRASDSLARRAPEGFRFAVKLHKSLTHERESLETGVLATREQNRPFADRGMLAAHLAQFPYSFHCTPESWSYVEKLADAVQPLCVEFRNIGWQGKETAERLRALGVSLCCVDEPRLKGLLRWEPVVTASPAYIRLHGRNWQKWHQHEHAWERYNYLYSEEELKEMVPAVKAMAGQARETLLFFNNHYGAQSVTNARQLAGLLGIETRPAQTPLF